MGPSQVPAVLFLIVAALKVSFAYIEALAANMDVNTAHKYEPMVAFICNKPPMHRIVDSWVADVSSEDTDCLQEPVEILKYCKKMYPDHDITNIVEASYKVTIPNWPNKQGHEHAHTIRPYRCIVGSFESDALLVPRHCFFDHDHDKVCESYQYWNRTSRHKCEKRDMVTESFAMLLACDVDRFNGVEFVCCPKDARVEVDDQDRIPEKDSDESDEKHDDDVVTSDDAYLAYLRGDESFLSKYSNEHEKFMEAEKAMQQHHHEKITKMMKEWQAAREHVAELKRTDYRSAENLNKEITQRFQKMYHAYEQEGMAEKQQLVTLHQQHVQAMLNKKKRVAMEEYMAALQDEPVKNHRVFKYLRAYIRAEEKDRIHTLNHFEHIRDTDPEEGQRIRDQTIEHLSTIDQRINQSMEMLSRFPKLEEKILPEIEKFRTQFRGIDASATNILLHPVSETEQKQLIDSYRQAEEDKKQKENAWLDTEIDLKHDDETDDGDDDNNDDEEDAALFGKNYDPETMEDENIYDNNANFVAHQAHDGQSIEQSVSHPVHHAVTTGNVFGIAIGSVAVFVIIVVAVVMLRKRSHRQPITHGFVEVDPAASPEERHVANMQMNGYENPTYKYFEMKPQ